MAERGFVPPQARKRLFHREQLKRKKTIRGLITAIALMGFLVFFVVFNIKFVNRIKKGSDTAKGGDVSFRQAVSSGSNPKLRNTKAWISQDSQPFNQEHWASRAHHL